MAIESSCGIQGIMVCKEPYYHLLSHAHLWAWDFMQWESYTYTYDAVNRLASVSAPLGYEKTFTYSLETAPPKSTARMTLTL